MANAKHGTQSMTGMLIAGAAIAMLAMSASLPLHASAGSDESLYVAPGTQERLGGFEAVMADQPDIQFSADSAFRNASPEDMEAIRRPLQSHLQSQLAKGGIRLATAPGPGVMHVHLAVTDLVLARKKRALLAYTPVGAVVNAGVDARKNIAGKYDISSVTLRAEVADSQTQEVLVKLSTARSAVRGQQRLTFDGLDAIVDSLSARLICQLDQARHPVPSGSSCS